MEWSASTRDARNCASRLAQNNLVIKIAVILGDPGADRGVGGKLGRAENDGGEGGEKRKRRKKIYVTPNQQRSAKAAAELLLSGFVQGLFSPILLFYALRLVFGLFLGSTQFPARPTIQPRSQPLSSHPREMKEPRNKVAHDLPRVCEDGSPCSKLIFLSAHTTTNVLCYTIDSQICEATLQTVRETAYKQTRYCLL